MATDMRRMAVRTPWSVLGELMDPSWLQAAARGDGGSNGHQQQVPLNAWETKEGFQIALMAPGADPAAIQVTAVGGTLTVEGEMKFETPEGASFVWREFGPSRFRRTIQLPDAINTEMVEAYYRNGVLLISVPKAEHAKPRNIQVKGLPNE